jgi:ribosomal protein L11 methylase PrmA
MFQRLSSGLWLVTLRGVQGKTRDKTLQIWTDEAFPPTHPTTCLCLALLREILAAGPVNHLLDVGCGAGVLGLAAAARGVPQVVGLDLAAPAARATLMNARENLLAGPLQVVRGSTECLKTTFDLVLANLPFAVQMAKARELDRLTTPAGSVLLSGFRQSQEKRLLEAYHRLGWSLRQRLVKDFRHAELPPEIDFTWVAWALRRG